MPRSRVLVLAWSLAAGSIAAQNAPAAVTKPPLLRFGTRFGGAFTELAREYQAPTLPRLAPIGGLYLEARFLPWLNLSVDALYTEFGGNAVGPLPLYGTAHPALKDLIQMNLQIQAMEFPVQVKFFVPAIEGNVVPYLSLGGSMSLFLTTTSHNFRDVPWDSSNVTNIRHVRVDMSDAMRGTDYAGLVATGLDVRGRRVWWSVEAFYRMGLSEVNWPRVPGLVGYSSNSVGVKIGVSAYR